MMSAATRPLAAGSRPAAAAAASVRMSSLRALACAARAGRRCAPASHCSLLDCSVTRPPSSDRERHALRTQRGPRQEARHLRARRRRCSPALRASDGASILQATKVSSTAAATDCRAATATGARRGLLRGAARRAPNSRPQRNGRRRLRAASRRRSTPPLGFWSVSQQRHHTGPPRRRTTSRARPRRSVWSRRGRCQRGEAPSAFPRARATHSRHSRRRGRSAGAPRSAQGPHRTLNDLVRPPSVRALRAAFTPP